MAYSFKAPQDIIIIATLYSVQFSSVTQPCSTLCNPMNCSTPGLPVHHQLPELTQTHVHWVGDAIQTSHPLLFLSPPALNLSQHQGLFKWVSSLHEVAKALEFQLQHQSIQWSPRTDLLYFYFIYYYYYYYYLLLNDAFYFFFISWRLITLQYCSGFCHTLTWISQGYTYIPHPDPPLPPPSPPDPSGSSQCTRSEHLAHASNLGWWSVSP